MPRKRTPASRAKKSSKAKRAKPRSQLLSQTCIITKGGGSMDKYALSFLVVAVVIIIVILRFAPSTPNNDGIVEPVVRLLIQFLK
jgi:hypothetical protein